MRHNRPCLQVGVNIIADKTVWMLCKESLSFILLYFVDNINGDTSRIKAGYHLRLGQNLIPE